jgi:hypothetical protein
MPELLFPETIFLPSINKHVSRGLFTLTSGWADDETTDIFRQHIDIEKGIVFYVEVEDWIGGRRRTHSWLDEQQYNTGAEGDKMIRCVE